MTTTPPHPDDEDRARFLAALSEAAAHAGVREEPAGAVLEPTTEDGAVRAQLVETAHGGLSWQVAGERLSPGAWVLRVVRFDQPTLGVGDALARRFELAHRPHRLRPFTPDTFTGPTTRSVDATTLRSWSTEGPVLLFVHGTANESHSGFGRIPAEVFAELSRRYDGRVVALDHPTVSVSPTDNVAWLDDTLAVLGDRRLTVDVVAHSRGGLVARLLAEQPQRSGGRLGVRRLVMVATPNRGTPLASERRIGQLLDRMTTLLRVVGGDLVRPLEVVLSVVGQLAAGVVDGLDGLAAMDPDGPFLTDVLNVPPTGAAGTGYRAVAADFEPVPGSPLADVALDAGSDLVFADVPNDLVVPTAGVYDVPGAPAFPVLERLVFDARAGVHHSDFWDRPAFTERLLGWLPPAGNGATPAPVGT